MVSLKLKWTSIAVVKAITLKNVKIELTEVIGSSRPNLKAKSFEVNLSKRRLPNTVPNVFATVDIMLTK